MAKTNPPVDEVLKKHENDSSSLIMVLQDIQKRLGYLTPEAIAYVSKALNVPTSQIYSIATFYKSFSLTPRGKHRIDICEGTACHIRGASILMDRVSEDLGIKAGETTEDGEFSLNSVHCVGACAMAPLAVIDGKYIGNVTAAQLLKEIKNCCMESDLEAAEEETENVPPIKGRIDSLLSFEGLKKRAIEERPKEVRTVLVCAGTGCLAKGSIAVAKALEREISSAKLDIPVSFSIKKVGCQGFCEKGPLVIVSPDSIFYEQVTPEDAQEIVQETLINKKTIDRLLYHEPGEEFGIDKYENIPFFAGQMRIALRNVGTIDPLNIYDYIAHDGYSALLKALYTMEPEKIIEEVIQSGLRGRGGGGFSTGRKWLATARSDSQIRFVICNGDEGDPGAFMDRSIMEGDPHAVLEGMIICAYAVGASQGYIYVREEYPRALKHLNAAIEQARMAGLLGQNICGTEFSFDIAINRGTGAFVCGESTALMQSIEGKVGEPRAKYIRSAERGLFDKPTVLNNVETFTNLPVIINNGHSWFSSTGTPDSPGTKVFSVVGKVKNTGLVEVPMGITLRSIIYDICGGILDDKPFKAVQTGGPSGGCLPESKLDLPVDFDTLTREGSMMGSGGMIVMDEDTCMVDVARYFTDFLTQESCGKCSACRMGLVALLEVLTRICAGRGETSDLEKMEQLFNTLDQGSLCGLGKTAANPVRSTLAHFKDEYLAHIEEKVCPAGVCRELIEYRIADLCNGCRRCARSCPQSAISGNKKEIHTIDQDLCNRCGICKTVCNFDAIAVSSRSTGIK